jgi:hypothetical protein
MNHFCRLQNKNFSTSKLCLNTNDRDRSNITTFETTNWNSHINRQWIIIQSKMVFSEKNWSDLSGPQALDNTVNK